MALNFYKNALGSSEELLRRTRNRIRQTESNLAELRAADPTKVSSNITKKTAELEKLRGYDKDYQGLVNFAKSGAAQVGKNVLDQYRSLADTERQKYLGNEVKLASDNQAIDALGKTINAPIAAAGATPVQTAIEPNTTTQGANTAPQAPSVRPAAYDATLGERVFAADTSKAANKEFVNAAFKAYHNRDANAEELAKFAGGNVGSVRDAIVAGSPLAKPKPFTAGFVPDSVSPDSVKGAVSGGTPISLDGLMSLDAGSTSSPDAFVASLGDVAKLLDMRSKEQVALEDERSGLIGRLESDTSELEGKGAALEKAYKDAGVASMTKQLQDVNMRIAQKMAAYQAGEAKILDQAIPAELLYGQQAALKRQQAADIGMLTAQAAALGDNISLASDLAEKSVEIMFMDEEQSIANTRMFLDINADNLSREEKKTADKVSILLSERERVLEEQKEEKRQNAALMLQVAQEGGDLSSFDMNASFAENVRRIGPSMAERAAMSKLALEEGEDIERAGKLISVLEKLPVGQSIEIGGSVYSSLNKGEVVTGTETSGGQTFLWSYNKNTGQKDVTLLGNFGDQKYTDVTSKEGAILRVFENGEKRLMFDPRQPNGGIAKGGLVELFPQGSVTPFSRPNDPNKDRASECGAWVNDCTGLGVGDTFASKKAKMDPTISAASAEIGDVFLQPYGSTGHIGIINAISEVDGEKIFTVSESNWSKAPGTNGSVGAITHTRQVKESEIAGFARPGFAQDFYNFGTGAAPLDLTGLTFGDAAEEEQGSRENVAVLQDKVKLIDSLLTSKGLPGSVGTYSIGRVTLYPDKAARQEFAAGVNQLIGKETIDTLINLKERGGTFGALSDQERLLLQTSATRIGTWLQRDKNGNPTGKFEVSEKVFKEELENIRTLAQRAIDNASGGPVASGGRIRVKLKGSGQTGTIDPSEFDSSLYEKL